MESGKYIPSIRIVSKDEALGFGQGQWWTGHILFEAETINCAKNRILEKFANDRKPEENDKKSQNNANNSVPFPELEKSPTLPQSKQKETKENSQLNDSNVNSAKVPRLEPQVSKRKEFKCTLCEKIVHSKAVLRIHMKFGHGVEMEIDQSRFKKNRVGIFFPGEKTPLQRIKDLKCKIKDCGKQFLSQKLYDEHLKFHEKNQVNPSSDQATYQKTISTHTENKDGKRKIVLDENKKKTISPSKKQKLFDGYESEKDMFLDESDNESIVSVRILGWADKK